jgi:hypothetical protein
MSIKPDPSVPFSFDAVRAGHWEIYHDDDCGETLTLDGLCPKCGFKPDLQSKGARRTIKEYRRVNAMNEERGIGWALKQMQHGAKVARAGWNGRGMWLALQRPDDDSKMTLPYIYMSTAQGDLVPWLASQTDILATDWDVFGAAVSA